MSVREQPGTTKYIREPSSRGRLILWNLQCDRVTGELPVTTLVGLVGWVEAGAVDGVFDLRDTVVLREGAREGGGRC